MENSSPKKSDGRVIEQKRYKHPRIALCKKCDGAGKIHVYDELWKESSPETCPDCKGSGRVKISSVITVETKVQAFVPGKDDGDHSVLMD